MNKEKLLKMQGKHLKIRPIARRIDATRGELEPIDDAWVVTGVSREEINLRNPRSDHILRLGTDHVREYMTDPGGTDGLLILKSQVTLRGTQISVEPLLIPNFTQTVNPPTINLSSEIVSRGVRERHIDALMKLIPKLNDALFYLQRIASAGKLRGEADDQELARRMAVNLASASEDFSANRLLMGKGFEANVNRFFDRMVSASTDLGLIFDPMVQDGNFRAQLWDNVKKIAYKELPLIFEAIYAEARTVIHG